MDYSRLFSPDARRALAYDPPGTWVPAARQGSIRLSAGYPAPEFLPVADLQAAIDGVLADEGDRPLQYVGSPSMNRLPVLLGHRMAGRGMAVAPAELLVTAGIAQGLDLAARVLLGPDDVAAVEAPTYMEALEILRNYTPHVLAYPVDGDGLNVEALAQDLAHRAAAGLPLPKLVYTIATFQNPTGATLSLERRYALLELAERYGFLIVEDDAYGELAFAAAPPPLKALDRTGCVLHLGSLSKVVAPGLRIGWAAGPEPVVNAMGVLKKDLDHAFVRAATARYLETTDFEARLAGLRAGLAARRDALCGALTRHMPPGITWTVPGGGFFLWVRVPGADTAALLPGALEAGVSFVAGRHFFVNPDEGREYLRLSFSYVTPADMEEGVRRLASRFIGHA